MALKRFLSPALRADLREWQTATANVLRSLRRSLLPPKLPKTPDIKLNLGCGPLGRPGWLNVDGFPVDRSVVELDLRNPLPLGDGLVRHIHCEHFLEHLHAQDGLQLLSECFRVLKPGGSLRLILPDAGKYMQAYVADDQDFFFKLRNIGSPSIPFATPIELVNQSLRMGGAHLYGWDECSLKLHLKRIGFTVVKRSFPHDIAAEFDLDGSDEWREVESIYLNAQRPD
jgi:predicted SAM-dependent methyltransferase